MSPSLRRRLLLLLAGTVLLGWLGAALLSYVDARHEIGEMLDAQLAQSAALIAAQLEHEIEDAPELAGAAAPVLPRLYKHERNIAFQVWDRDGNLRLRSVSAPTTRLAARETGFVEVLLSNERWRVFSRRDAEDRYLVQVAERYALRDELARSVAGHLLNTLLVALPILALLMWFAVGAGLAPLVRLADDIARRAPDNLAPFADDGAPREVRPLLAALNALFARVCASMEQERRFTADAAHELRTPLAAVKTQAQVALGARDDEERLHALNQVVEGSDRAAHLVEQLLALARLDPQTTLGPTASVSLRRLAVECLAAQAPLAMRKGIALSLQAAEDDEGWVEGDASLLAALLRNLVDNAVRYSPAQSDVDVEIVRAGQVLRLRVSDQGPGIPAEERERVCERFYRVLGSNEAGSGLGLSIVKRIADLHHASMALDDGAGSRGLAVTMHFPAAV